MLHNFRKMLHHFGIHLIDCSVRRDPEILQGVKLSRPEITGMILSVSQIQLPGLQHAQRNTSFVFHFLKMRRC